MAALTINITVLLHVTTCTLVNRFPSFLGNVLPLSSRSKLNAAGSYERWYQTACVTFHNRAMLSRLFSTLLKAPFSSVTQQTNSGLGRLIVEVCRSQAHALTNTGTHTYIYTHTHTHTHIHTHTHGSAPLNDISARLRGRYLSNT